MSSKIKFVPLIFATIAVAGLSIKLAPTAAGQLIAILLSIRGDKYISDIELQRRFNIHRSEYVSLLETFDSQSADEISFPGSRAGGQEVPGKPTEQATREKIVKQLKALNLLSIARNPSDGVVTLQIELIDVSLLRGRRYYFVYFPRQGPSLTKIVQSLYQARPYTAPGSDPYMPMGKNWYASVYEDP